ncbi:unnamed protein product [Musa acuminata subsp. malaccensis]|uniref:(wild Malaysian banana) hypothetical protein n=1 Tax=Musa acuminata subsp. malaccensis TaxID=214687 RepID=A0A804IJ69_MUSAM|nr:unnamed protein product [Musa acuminata subsp. malaccensis]
MTPTLDRAWDTSIAMLALPKGKPMPPWRQGSQSYNSNWR